MKTCSACGQTKPLDSFYADKRRRYGRRSDCKECHRDRARASRIKYLYGITADEYAAKLREQGGVCDICGKTPEQNGGNLAVDHDHSCCPGGRSCGKCVRGLLCDMCNRAIGLMQDDAERMRRAAAYIEGACK